MKKDEDGRSSEEDERKKMAEVKKIRRGERNAETR